MCNFWCFDCYQLLSSEEAGTSFAGSWHNKNIIWSVGLRQQWLTGSQINLRDVLKKPYTSTGKDNKPWIGTFGILCCELCIILLSFIHYSSLTLKCSIRWDGIVLLNGLVIIHVPIVSRTRRTSISFF